jgi:hypothetical protein
MSKDMIVRQLTRECDDLAARFWQREASGRGQAYLEWLQKVKQTADIIEKNRLKVLYFYPNRLEFANTNAFRRFAEKKVEESRRK